jgi:hypothetical protein
MDIQISPTINLLLLYHQIITLALLSSQDLKLQQEALQDLPLFLILTTAVSYLFSGLL